jgi:stage V sporulation protein G
MKTVVPAYVDITLDHCLVIHGLALIQHSTGYLVAMPRNKPRGGKHYDVAFPIKAKTPKIIEQAIMAEYKTYRLPASKTTH